MNTKKLGKSSVRKRNLRLKRQRAAQRRKEKERAAEIALPPVIQTRALGPFYDEPATTMEELRATMEKLDQMERERGGWPGASS